MSEINPTASKSPQIRTNRFWGLTFCVFMVLLAGSAYQLYISNQLLREVRLPIDNHNDVCDETELFTARIIDDTPCGDYLERLVFLNQSI